MNSLHTYTQFLGLSDFFYPVFTSGLHDDSKVSRWYEKARFHRSEHPQRLLWYLVRLDNGLWKQCFTKSSTVTYPIQEQWNNSWTGLPAAPTIDEPSIEALKPLKLKSLSNEIEQEERLGPLEPPISSKSFRRNFTFLINSHQLWNEKFFMTSRMPPYTPYEPLLPTEAKFQGSNLGYRPIGCKTTYLDRGISKSIEGLRPLIIRLKLVLNCSLGGFGVRKY